LTVLILRGPYSLAQRRDVALQRRGTSEHARECIAPQAQHRARRRSDEREPPTCFWIDPARAADMVALGERAELELVAILAELGLERLAARDHVDGIGRLALTHDRLADRVLTRAEALGDCIEELDIV